MADFSSFFPTAGGGGGFTKMNKYSTSRALNDANFKLVTSVTGLFQVGTKPIGTTTLTDFQIQSGGDKAQDELVGSTFVHNSTTHTITSNSTLFTAVSGTIVFTPGFTASMSPFTNIVTTPLSFFTVNPATDLGLEDGASIYIFMVSGGQSSTTSTNAGYGGRILQKTAIISNASTDLVLTIGVGANANTNNLGSDSTISGGLTLTTSDGYNGAGVGHNTTSKFTGEGINAYGLGGGTQSDRGGGTGQHGWGNGNYFAGPGGDGAILLYY